MGSMPPRKTFAEFFAGIGLVHLGLADSGWGCVYANDIDAKKQQMYADHFGDARYYHREDVWRTDAVIERLDERPFLATAWFPCTDLSLAGYGRGFGGPQSSSYFGFIEVLRQLGDERPRLVMLENVVGFLTARGGGDFRRAVQTLASLGYRIDAFILDARWFVPQSRPRLFVFGFHESLDHGVILKEDADRWRQAIDRTAPLRPATLAAHYDTLRLDTGWATVDLPTPAPNERSLNDVIDLDDAQDWWDEPTTRKHEAMMEPRHRARVETMMAGGAPAAGAAFRRTRRGKPRLEVRFDLAGCLRTPRGGSARQIVLGIGRGRLRMRWMSAREYARLQGADDFAIRVSPSQAMHGFGDAVCVPAIRWIDRHVLSPIHDHEAAAHARPVLHR